MDILPKFLRRDKNCPEKEAEAEAITVESLKHDPLLLQEALNAITGGVFDDFQQFVDCKNAFLAYLREAEAKAQAAATAAAGTVMDSNQRLKCT